MKSLEILQNFIQDIMIISLKMTACFFSCFFPKVRIHHSFAEKGSKFLIPQGIAIYCPEGRNKFAYYSHTILLLR